MPYVNERWLGGLLTNFHTIRKRIDRLHDLTRLTDEGQLDLLPTKERMSMEAELEKLPRTSAACATWSACPDAVFVTDLKVEEIGVREAGRLHIPTIGLVDTNCDPEAVDYVIPGNDDAIRSNELVIRAIGEAAAEGRARASCARRSRCAARPRRRHASRPRRAPGARPRRRPARGRGAGAPGGGGGRSRRPRQPRRRGEQPRRTPARRRRPPAEQPAPAPPRGRRDTAMSISAADVKALRERTGAGMMECKRALRRPTATPTRRSSSCA